MSKSVESFSEGLNALLNKPILFAPYIAPMIIQLIFNALAEMPLSFISLFGGFLAAIVGFIAGCMLIDMASDCFKNRSLDLNKSLNLVINRIGVLTVAAVIAAICSITIILLPVALFIMVIVVIENLSVVESVKKSLGFVIENLGEVIIFIILVVAMTAISSLAFYIGTIITWLLNSLFTVSAVHLYLALNPPQQLQ